MDDTSRNWKLNVLKVIKWGFIVSVILCLIIGSATIIQASIMHVHIIKYQDFAAKDFHAPDWMNLLLTVIALVHAIVGYFTRSDKTQSLVLLTSLGICSCGVLAGIGLIYSTKYSYKIRETIELKMNKSLKQLVQGTNKKQWNFLQSSLECCGIGNSEEYKEFLTVVPSHCCGDLRNNSCTILLNVTGCKRTLQEYLSSEISCMISLQTGSLILLIAVACLGVIYLHVRVMETPERNQVMPETENTPLDSEAMKHANEEG